MAKACSWRSRTCNLLTNFICGCGWMPSPRGTIFLTVHRLGGPFTAIPNYRPRGGTKSSPPIRSWPTSARPPRPPRIRSGHSRKAALPVAIRADKNLSFVQRSFTVRARRIDQAHLHQSGRRPAPAGCLAKPESLARVGDLANRLIAEPDAVEKTIRAENSWKTSCCTRTSSRRKESSPSGSAHHWEKPATLTSAPSPGTGWS